MKIACISTSQVPSRTANSIQVMKACHALVETGHQVCLWIPGCGGESWEALAAFYGLRMPFETRWLAARPAFRRYDFSLAAVRQAERWGADVLYVWPAQAAALGLFRGRPVLFELHGPPEGRLGPAVFRLILRWPGKKRFLPITQALAAILEKTYRVHFRPGEMVVSPNGVDLERFRGLVEPSEARRQLGLRQAFTAGYTGHLYLGRGMSLLLGLARRFPQVQFLWAGGRPEELEVWRARLNEEEVENIHLAGFVENSRLPLFQAACEVLLMPYERQISGSGGGNSADYCSPMKMFEYMASGRAILSSDLPVIREVLGPEEAVLLPPDDLESWCNALDGLIADPARREALGSQAKLEAGEYTWQARARRALAGFSDVEM